MNQRRKPPLNGLFAPVGRFSFDGEARVVIHNRDADGYVVVDAVQFVK